MTPKPAPSIAVIAGDGIGTEVVPAAIAVLDSALAANGQNIDWVYYDWGCDYFVQHGQMMPAVGLDQLARHDAILLGAVGRPDVPDHEWKLSRLGSAVSVGLGGLYCHSLRLCV